MIQLIDFEIYRQSIKNASKYETLFNNSIDIILTVKDTGEIIDCNEKALKEYGYNKEELLKLKIYDIRRNDVQDITSEQILRTMQKGVIFETIHFRKDGTTFPVEVRAVGIEIEGEKIIFSIVRDITISKRLLSDLNKKMWS